jgi:hypothetical protein
MMQIRELVIYGLNGKVRRLSFKLGEANIITGKSESGKSAVGAIIDYCLGGSSCNIADGIVRDNAEWYGLLLQFKSEQLFVARKNPPADQQSSGYCYVERGEQIAIPEGCNFIPNLNYSGLEELLSGMIGISENLHNTPDGQSHLSLSANIRHTLFYCFQNQYEIASPEILFHRQQEDFITQAIKDTLPYFLGIVNDDSLAMEQERTRLKRQIVIEKRRLDESLALRGGGLDRAISLVSESKEVGLLSKEIIVDFDDYNAVKDVLSSVDEWKPDSISTIGTDRLSALQSELAECESELETLNLDIESAKSYSGASNGYENAVKHQTMRLQSIGLFEQLDFSPNHCPLCSSDMGENPLPYITAIKTAIINLNREIENVDRERPKILEYLNGLENSRQKLREKIQSLRAEIDGIYEHNRSANAYRDLMARRAKVAGRISLWLDSMNSADNYDGKQATIAQLESRLREIDAMLSQDDLEERKASVLNRIAINMSKWAKELQLEHANNPYRFDLNKVTVMVDKPERPISLRQLGSGANWVGVHLITHFALHKFFIDAERPVPRFVFIDQPSQVYFPSERKDKRQDWEKIRALYQFIFNRIDEFNSQLQLIIVDHADLTDPNFTEAVIEDWIPENSNLIPVDWYKGTKE